MRPPYALFIDDERLPPANSPYTWRVARNAQDVADILGAHGSPCHISFDHDLGDNEPSGYDIAKAMVDSDLESAPAAFGIAFSFCKSFFMRSFSFAFLRISPTTGKPVNGSVRLPDF